MYSILSRRAVAQTRYPLRQSLCRFSTTQRLRNNLITPKVDYESKYAEKLKKAAEQCVDSHTFDSWTHRNWIGRQGISVAELRQRLKEEEAAKRREKLAAAAQDARSSSTQVTQEHAKTPTTPPAPSIPPRQDSSPVKAWFHSFTFLRYL